MSVLKYKNSQGNWVEASDILCRGQLKIEQITRATENSYDLTKYKDCNDFLLFYYTSADALCVFSPNYNADGTQWHWALGAENKNNFSSSDFIRSLFAPYEGASSLDPIPTNRTKYENGIFTYLHTDSYNENYVGVNAFVIYAG